VNYAFNRLIAFLLLCLRNQLGDRVYWCRSIGGSYRELTLTSETCTFPLHSDLSFQQGAAIGTPYFTAYRALVTKAGLKAGETVLVHGASGAVCYSWFLCID